MDELNSLRSFRTNAEYNDMHIKVISHPVQSVGFYNPESKAYHSALKQTGDGNLSYLFPFLKLRRNILPFALLTSAFSEYNWKRLQYVVLL